MLGGGLSTEGLHRGHTHGVLGEGLCMKGGLSTEGLHRGHTHGVLGKGRRVDFYMGFGEVMHSILWCPFKVSIQSEVRGGVKQLTNPQDITSNSTFWLFVFLGNLPSKLFMLVGDCGQL